MFFLFIFQEKERLVALEKRYNNLTGGKSFPKSSTAMREVREEAQCVGSETKCSVMFTAMTLRNQQSFDDSQLILTMFLSCSAVLIRWISHTHTHSVVSYCSNEC